jgi:large subunit ribosomal protein L2
MKLKFLKPTTSSQRHVIKLNKNHLTKKPLIKTNVKGLKNSSGRNNFGKITVRNKGGGHKKKYRKINFMRTLESTGIVCSIEYDPNRNANIASIYDFSKNYFFYMLAPKGLTIGNIVKSGLKAKPNTGNSLPLSEIPIGNFIHNISPKPSHPAKIARAAGTFAKLEEKTLKHARLELTSGEHKLVSLKSYATIGVVSNELSFLTQDGKAGKSRWLNKRPKVRGVAMNPIDHPHGGGEGKKSGKAVTPWGKPVRKGKSKNKLIKNG